MDTSNRIAIEMLIGRTKLRASSFSATDWRLIIEYALETCKPQLKYFPEFAEIGKSLDRRDENSKTRWTIPTGMLTIKPNAKPGDITERTRCVRVATLESGFFGKNKREGAAYRNESALYLSQDGTWLDWESRYRREMTDEFTMPMGGFGGWHETAERSVITPVGLNAIQNFFVQNGVGKCVFDTIRRITLKGVTERRERLQKMEGTSERLERIAELINW